MNNDVQGTEGTQHEKGQKPLSSFVKQHLIDEAQESSNYIIEEEIPAPCGSESVNKDMVSKAAEECSTLHQMFEERWDILDNHPETSSDFEEACSYSSADEHSEIEPL